MVKNNQKKQYLTPTIVSVAFKVEVGQVLSGGKSTANQITEFTTVYPSAAASSYGKESTSNWPTFE